MIRLDREDLLTRGVQFGSHSAVRTVRYSSGDILYVVSASAAGSVSVVLPDASRSAGQRHTVKNNGTAGTVRITAAGGLLDNTATASAATSLFAITFVSDGANWWRIASEP